MPSLFDPLTIQETIFRNRIVLSPMCMYSSIDGFANDFHLVHLGSKAIGGAGLVFTEATAVTQDGRISPDDLGIWKDEQIPFLKRITTFIESQGAVPGIQLAHAGRKASQKSPWKGGAVLSIKEGAWTTSAPSAVPFSENSPIPAEMSLKDIDYIIQAFEDAAIRALKAGFRVIEIHAAHGYLLHEFLSPVSNMRKDEYGGDLNNRIRIVAEVTDIIRSVWPRKYPLFVRISSTDWMESGWSVSDSVILAGVLKSKGADLIDCSSGGIAPGINIPAGPGYQVSFAEAIKAQANIMTGAVGLITTPEQAEEIISTGKADMVFIAREFLRDSNFPLRAAHVLNQEIKWPVQFDRGKFR